MRRLVKKCGLIGVLALLLCDDGRGRCKFMDLQFRRFGGALFKTKNGKISFVGSEKIKNNRIIGTHCYRCSQGLGRGPKEEISFMSYPQILLKLLASAPRLLPGKTGGRAGCDVTGTCPPGRRKCYGVAKSRTLGSRDHGSNVTLPLKSHFLYL